MKKKEQRLSGGGKEKESEDMSIQNQHNDPSRSSPAKESPIRVEEKDLWEVYQERNRATQEWFNFMANNFGVIPDEIVVSKATHNLMFAYLFARGVMAAGNWLDLCLNVSYDLRFTANDMRFCDQWTGAEINYGGGDGDFIQFFQKDIIKKTKTT